MQKIKTNQLNWITVENVMHWTRNKSQSCRKPNLQKP